MSEAIQLQSRHPDLSRKDLERLRARLDAERAGILDLLEHDLDEARSQDQDLEDFPGHATAETAREQLLALSESERDQLRRIEEALGRLGDGGYGLCQHDGEPIPVGRLDAVPWARYCLEHEELAEKGELD